jgi:hypothetical protein
MGELPSKKKKREAGGRATALPLPLFCDFSCPHAAFPPADAVGACRREQAVYCTLLEKYNNKNAKCIGNRKGERRKG